MKIGFIGAGKVGVSLGKYFKDFGENISGYYSKSYSSALFASEFTNTSAFSQLCEVLKESDMILITVPDSQIKTVWENIKKCGCDLTGKIICHTSGSVSSGIFDGARDTGAYAFSVHPLQAISDKTNSVSLLKGAVFTIEGSKEKIQFVSSFIKKFGNTVSVIDEKDKTLYHAAAVFVSNLPAALCDMGEKMLIRCGFERENARKALAPLIEGAAKNIAEKGAVNALTGPVERGDCETVLNHLKVLDGKEKSIYLDLTDILISVAEEKNPERDYTELKNLIKSEG